MLNAAIMKQAFPHCAAPDVWANALNSALPKFGIDTPDRIASFLAQTGYESGQFNHLEENLNYTASNLIKVWPNRFPNVASAAPYVNNPRKLGDYVYANRMGNGDVASDDGYRFRGRGIIQLTGRSNYAAAAKAIGVGLIEHPELLAQPVNACLSGAWFWQTRGLNELADDRTGDDDLEDFTEITRRINGSTTGVNERFALFKQVATALQ
ncbi:glycoside hydrolase family 19 protein [Paraburkholderia sp. BR10882]|uniref:glycoside hydrolase family 19 protein n=1 Tax=unclassified Paraburkholderia TaxID=2615204 RepID=UPI0034CEE613